MYDIARHKSLENKEATTVEL